MVDVEFDPARHAVSESFFGGRAELMFGSVEDPHAGGARVGRCRCDAHTSLCGRRGGEASRYCLILLGGNAKQKEAWRNVRKPHRHTNCKAAIVYCKSNLGQINYYLSNRA